VGARSSKREEPTIRRNFIEPVHQMGGFRLPHRTRCES
jgi:hypothetical protein